MYEHIILKGASVFEIKKLNVSVDGRHVVKDISLSMGAGEIHVLMGPNGSGKTSFAQALMGQPRLKVSGSIKLDGKELTKLSPDERARLGLFLSFQNPEEIEGVKTSNLMRKAMAARGKAAPDMDEMLRMHEQLIGSAEKLGMDKDMVSRELNVGFSGGEKKRMEILQMIALDPKLAVLDEPDSGLDVDGIKLIASAIKELSDGKRSFLIITHHADILKYLEADHVHVLAHGRIVKSDGMELAHEIEEKGYGEYNGGSKDA